MAASEYLKRLRAALGRDAMLLLPGAAAVVLDDGGRVLVQQRAESGAWGLPGGAIDPGETPAAAVRREVREETGLDVEPVRVAGVFGGPGQRITYPNGEVTEYVTIVFQCRVVGGALRKQDDESAQLKWFAPGEMPPLIVSYPAEVFVAGGATVF